MATELLWGISYGNARHIVQPETVSDHIGSHRRSGIGLCGQTVDNFSDDTRTNVYDWAPSLRRSRTWSETVMRRKPCKRCLRKAGLTTKQAGVRDGDQ